MRARLPMALVALAVTVACGDGGSGPSRDQLAGTWDATRLEFTNVANTSEKVEVIGLGATAVLFLQGDGTYQLTTALPGEAPEVTSGTWSVSQDVFTLRESATSSQQFSWSLSGSTLTLSGADTDFDFNGDSVTEPAKVSATLVRR